MRRYAVLVAFSLVAFLSTQAAHAYPGGYGPEATPDWQATPYSRYHPWDREFTRHRYMAHHGRSHAQPRHRQYPHHALRQASGHPLDIRSPAQIVSHPSGCPGRSFCGCGVALRVFGHHVRDLWLARNWFRFPRSAPAAGTVAIFRGGGHVAYIEQVHGDGTATLYDPNSGGHLTRLHRRSLAGAVIVDPHGGYTGHREGYRHYATRHRYWHHRRFAA